MAEGLNLVTTQEINGIACDFFVDTDGEIYMTRGQIGSALEYLHPLDAIKDIHRRHKNRLEHRCIRVMENTVEPLKIKDSHEGVQSATPREDSIMHNTDCEDKFIVRPQNKHLMTEVIYYNEYGIMEICRWSEMPKADAFMDRLYDIVHGIRHGKYALATKEEFDKCVLMVQQLQSQVDEMQKNFSSLDYKVDVIRGSLVDMKAGEMDDVKMAAEWKEAMYEKCSEAGKGRLHADGTPYDGKQVIGELVRIMKDRFGVDFEGYVRHYRLKYGLSYAPVLDVVACNDDLVDCFEGAYEVFTGEHEADPFLDGGWCNEEDLL